MAKASSRELQRRVQTQNMIIIALAIIIFVLVVVSGTAAWYIRTKSDSADIILSNPVNIYITEFKDLTDATGAIVRDPAGNPIQSHSLKTDILEQYNTKIYPGDKIKLKLGLQIGTTEVESSPAYVRVKLSITFENIYTGETSGLDGVNPNMITYKDEPDSLLWEKVNFASFAQLQNPETPDDYWFVLRDTNNLGRTVSRIAYNLEQYAFLDGYIELNKLEITNAQANCKFHINYVVEAIQVVNVPDPLANPGYGPWWGFALGDVE